MIFPMKKILLTGFEPFGGSDINYSEEAVKLCSVPDNVDKALIPVGFEVSHRRVAELLEKDSYDAVILVGQAGARDAVTVEKIGINWQQAGIPDNYGVMPLGEKLEEDGPDGIFSKVDINALIKAMNEKGVGARISFSAGSYVCNALYYRTLLAFPGKETVFIHLPAKELEKSVTALEAAVKYAMND